MTTKDYLLLLTLSLWYCALQGAAQQLQPGRRRLRSAISDEVTPQQEGNTVFTTVQSIVVRNDAGGTQRKLNSELNLVKQAVQNAIKDIDVNPHNLPLLKMTDKRKDMLHCEGECDEDEGTS